MERKGNILEFKTPVRDRQILMGIKDIVDMKINSGIELNDEENALLIEIQEWAELTKDKRKPQIFELKDKAARVVLQLIDNLDSYYPVNRCYSNDERNLIALINVEPEIEEIAYSD
jgi:hypothetical protein